ncbi:hypothetical protein [Streptomyces mirabilis]|uniref:hypothetical protein n=1 Tax=Streptomyces mirabilis TaxID=68239 RepID=UPI0034083FCB
MTDQIRAPWTPEQVAALNRFQREGGMHPFTCGGDHAPGSPALVAYTDGWRCPQPYGEACDYRQDWAHRFMADPDAWPKPFADLRKAAATERSAAPVEPPTRLRRLRAQLAAEHAKAVRADQHPRPDLDHLHVTAHNGIAAGLEMALFFTDHHLREVDEEARTTPDNPATSGDAADNSLRERLAAVLSTFTVLGGAPPTRLVPVIRWGAGEVTRIADWRPLEALLDHLEGAVDAALDIGEEQAWCKTCRRVWDGPRHRCETDAEQQHAAQAALVRDQAVLAQVRLHIAAHRPRLLLADPVLLGKIERVLKQPAELEPAGGGEGA